MSKQSVFYKCWMSVSSWFERIHAFYLYECLFEHLDPMGPVSMRICHTPLARTWLTRWTGQNGWNNQRIRNQPPRRCPNPKRCLNRWGGVRSWSSPNVWGRIGIRYEKVLFCPQCLQASMTLGLEILIRVYSIGVYRKFIGYFAMCSLCIHTFWEFRVSGFWGRVGL